jgi:Na+/melibiose symporter-like transporter
MSANREAAPAPDPGGLPRRIKAIYALGDHTVNLALASLLFLFPYFLTDVVGLRPALAGLVPLAGRIVDAFTDPAMGRFSDLTRLRAGRRRPYFLIGMLPFGASFAALWWNVDATDQSALGAYYITAYVVFSVSSTVLAVPYLALIPEIAASYQERTSLNTYRAVGSILGALLAVVMVRPLAEAFGGGRDGFQWAGLTARRTLRPASASYSSTSRIATSPASTCWGVSRST